MPRRRFKNIQQVNDQAEMVSRGHALAMNIASAKGIGEVVKSNLGPKGTLKMCAPPPAVLPRRAAGRPRVAP